MTTAVSSFSNEIPNYQIDEIGVLQANTHPKLVKQKSVTFGKVETEANGVVTSIINLANDVQAGLYPENSSNAETTENTNNSSTEAAATTSFNSLSDMEAASRRDQHHLHHHHHYHHHTAHVTVHDQTSQQGSLSSHASSRLSSVSTSTGHLSRALRETWDSKLSFFLACLSCTVGMFNINKFSLLVIRFGGAFIFEYILLSLVIGLPLYCMYLKLGQYVRTGLISMWFISPAFKGIGITLVVMLWMIGICSAVPITWMINFFRDSFVTGNSSYKWHGCVHEYALKECVDKTNQSEQIGLEISSYFHGRILKQLSDKESGLGSMNIENIVFLSLIWAFVFLCLIRGLKWYSKVIYVVAFIPEISILALGARLVHSNDDISYIFNRRFIETLSDEMSWYCAAKEVFFTWIILGAVVMQLASHSKNIIFTNRMLIILFVVTNTVLILFSCSFASCIKTIEENGLLFISSSFENEHESSFLSPENSTISEITINNLMFGTYFDSQNSSKYQIMRLSIELFPATMSLKQTDDDSATFWCALFYLTMIFFGVGQLLVITRVIVESVIELRPTLLNRWRICLTLTITTSMLLCGLPMLSSNGVHILHFADFTFGSLWWIAIIYLFVNIGIFHIKSPDENVSLLTYIAHQSLKPKMIAIILVITWMFLAPAMLLSLFGIFLKKDGGSYIFDSSTYPFKMWNSQVQKLFIGLPMAMICLPFIVFLCIMMRSYFKCGGQTTIIKIIEDIIEPNEPLPKWPLSTGLGRLHSRSSRSSSLSSRIFNFGIYEDPPPKYTPPPSYSSATAKSILNELQDLHIEMNILSVSENPSGNFEQLDDDNTMSISKTE